MFKGNDSVFNTDDLIEIFSCFCNNIIFVGRPGSISGNIKSSTVFSVKVFSKVVLTLLFITGRTNEQFTEML